MQGSPWPFGLCLDCVRESEDREASPPSFTYSSLVVGLLGEVGTAGGGETKCRGRGVTEASTVNPDLLAPKPCVSELRHQQEAKPHPSPLLKSPDVAAFWNNPGTCRSPQVLGSSFCLSVSFGSFGGTWSPRLSLAWVCVGVPRVGRIEGQSLRRFHSALEVVLLGRLWLSLH